MENKLNKKLSIAGYGILLLTVIIMIYQHKSVSYNYYFVLKGIYSIVSIMIFSHLLELKIKFLNVGWGLLSVLIFIFFIEEFKFINSLSKRIVVIKETFLPIGMLCMVHGFYSYIREKEMMLNKLHFMAFKDQLTNIPNRRFLEEQLSVAIQREQKKIGLLFIDLNKFKSVNDAFGHNMGDKLLKQVANRMKGILRETDSVARLGGDEFMVVSYNINDIEEVENIVQRVLDIFKKDFVLKDQSVNISCSCGVSVYPDHGTDIKILFKKADDAMYQAKKRGCNGYMIYDSCMHKNISNVVEMDKSRRDGFQRKKFSSVN